MKAARCVSGIALINGMDLRAGLGGSEFVDAHFSAFRMLLQMKAVDQESAKPEVGFFRGSRVIASSVEIVFDLIEPVRPDHLIQLNAPGLGCETS